MVEQTKIWQKAHKRYIVTLLFQWPADPPLGKKTKGLRRNLKSKDENAKNIEKFAIKRKNKNLDFTLKKISDISNN